MTEELKRLLAEELADMAIPGSRHQFIFDLAQRIERTRPAPAPVAVPEGAPEYAEFYVGQGRYAIVDWQDYELVKGYNWRLTTAHGSHAMYAQAWNSHDSKCRKRVTMHGLIMRPGEGLVVDHISGDGLDNRRANLRIATVQQNCFNQRDRLGASKFKGVSLEGSTGLWRAYITIDGRRLYLGRHGIEVDAAKAYNMAAKEHFGDFARLNHVD